MFKYIFAEYEGNHKEGKYTKADKIKDNIKKIKVPNITILKALPNEMVWMEYFMASPKFISPIIMPGITKQFLTKSIPKNIPAIIPIKGLAEILNAIKPLEKIKKPLLNNRNKNIFIN
jgi:hypothetical protein